MIAIRFIIIGLWYFFKRNIWNFLVLISLIGISSLALYQSARAIGLVDGNWWSGMWQNFATEMIGAIMTFILFEILINANNRQEALVRQMASTDHHTALAASNELRALGYLFDGTLHRKSFAFAHLTGVDLSGASLRKTDFQGANLQDAVLIDTNLQGANLQGSSLIGARMDAVQCDHKTRLPDGQYWSANTDWTHYTQGKSPSISITKKRPQSHHYRLLRTKKRH
ncbi:MAG: pentapeptide repeat-containing protein [Phototrophicaceae bacterium]